MIDCRLQGERDNKKRNSTEINVQNFNLDWNLKFSRSSHRKWLIQSKSDTLQLWWTYQINTEQKYMKTIWSCPFFIINISFNITQNQDKKISTFEFIWNTHTHTKWFKLVLSFIACGYRLSGAIYETGTRKD